MQERVQAQGRPRRSTLAEQRLWQRQRLRPHEQAGLVPELGRHELEALRTDIARRGLLVPLEITNAGVVLDGRARLQVAELLGIEELPVRILAPADEREHMLLCALRRRHLTASQQAALALELESYARDREQAERRRLANLHGSAEVATLPPRGKTRERVAQRIGVSARTVQDAATVLAEDPLLFEAVKQGRIAAAHAARQVRRARRDAAFPPPPPLPEGPFELLYADPPWQLGHPHGPYAPENHYPTLSLEQLAALQPPAAADAVLFLWAVSCRLPDALQLMEAWGFQYKTSLVWVKDWIGLGSWVRHRHEPLLLGRKGSYPAPDPEDRPDSVIQAARGRHSEKPPVVYELLERAYPHASRLELFARGRPRPGWTSWGNEAET
jgi:N6-adenosine-specific RNA methylase IME4/ParB-like chromosome segregation protein Spo0J